MLTRISQQISDKTFRFKHIQRLNIYKVAFEICGRKMDYVMNDVEMDRQQSGKKLGSAFIKYEIETIKLLERYRGFFLSQREFLNMTQKPEAIKEVIYSTTGT